VQKLSECGNTLDDKPVGDLVRTVVLSSITRSLPCQFVPGCHPRVDNLPRCQLVFCCVAAV